MFPAVTATSEELGEYMICNENVSSLVDVKLGTKHMSVLLVRRYNSRTRMTIVLFFNFLKRSNIEAETKPYCWFGFDDEQTSGQNVCLHIYRCVNHKTQMTCYT